MARHVGRKTIRVPDAGEGPAHSPERLAEAPGMMAFSVDFYALPTNTGRIYVGWAGTSGIPGGEIGIPLALGDVATLENPIRDGDGDIVAIDLYDLFVSGANDGDGVTFFSW